MLSKKGKGVKKDTCLQESNWCEIFYEIGTSLLYFIHKLDGHKLLL